MPGSPESVLVQALSTKGSVVTIDTIPGSNSTFTPDNLLVEGHAYTVVGYDAKTGLFTLHNPWGNAPPESPSVPTQPVGLTWAQLNADCDQYVIGTTNNSTSITSGIVPTTPVTKTYPTNLHRVRDTTGGVGAAAANAWFAASSSQTGSKNDPPQASAHDLALMAYLA